MNANGLPRRSGVSIDVPRLDYEMARRAITQRQLARQAGVPEVTLSRARHGRRVTNSTLRRLSTALLQIPLMVGADLLIAPPARNGEAAAGLHSAATPKDGAPDSATMPI